MQFITGRTLTLLTIITLHLHWTYNVHVSCTTYTCLFVCFLGFVVIVVVVVVFFALTSVFNCPLFIQHMKPKIRKMWSYLCRLFLAYIFS